MDEKLITIGADQGVGQNAAGVIVAANEARFAQSHYSEEVSNFVINLAGTEMASLIAERDIIMPGVRVGRRFEFKKSKGGLAFLADQDDTRAIGAAFTKVSDRRTSINSKTVNRGLTITLDNDDVMDGDVENAARQIQAILLRNDIRRAHALLLANDTNAAKVWDGDADPDGDVLLDGDSTLGDRGVSPNTVVYGSTAWIYRRAAYIANASAAAGTQAFLTPEQVAAMLAVDHVHVSKTVCKLAKNGTKTKLFGNMVFSYYADPIASKDDASNLKRFWSPCRSGGEFATYVNEMDKVTEVTVEQYTSPSITDSTGIRSQTVSQS